MDWGEDDIVADRNTGYAEFWRFEFVDLTGGDFKLGIRQYPGAPDVPLFEVGAVTVGEGIIIAYAGTDTVANHIAAGRLEGVPLGLDMTSMMAVSRLGVQINKATIQSMPLSPEPGEDMRLFYDFQAAPAGRPKQVWLRGSFIIRPGAAQ